MSGNEKLERAKPILFNTKMVRAILDGRKLVTRRIVKYTRHDVYGAACAKGLWSEAYDPSNHPERLVEWFVREMARPPYRPGDILYMRETWNTLIGDFIYKADQKPGFKNTGKWRPSIHMPREAARIFLRVTDVKVERLQEIDGYGILAEAIDNGSSNPSMGKRWENMQRIAFQDLWDSTVKSSVDRALYGWEANPWVWVIGFGRSGRAPGIGGGDQV